MKTNETRVKEMVVKSRRKGEVVVIEHQVKGGQREREFSGTTKKQADHDGAQHRDKEGRSQS